MARQVPIIKIENFLANGDGRCGLARITVEAKREFLAADERGKAVLERDDASCKNEDWRATRSSPENRHRVLQPGLTRD